MTKPNHRLLFPLVLAVLVFALPPRLASAQDKPQRIAQHNAWGVYMASPDGVVRCWAMVRPDQQSDRKIRGPAYLMVTSRPQENVWNEVSLIMDFELGSGADLTVELGNRTYAMWTTAAGAWLKDPTEESGFLQSLMAGTGPTLTIRASFPKRVVDRYALRGAKPAIEAAVEACRRLVPAAAPPTATLPEPARPDVASVSEADRNRCQDSASQRADAIAACTRLITGKAVSGSELAVIYLWRGMHRSLDSEHQAAIRDYDAALQLDAGMAQAYVFRAVLLEFLGELKRALADYRAALAIDPTLQDAATGAQRIAAKVQPPAP